MILLILSYQGMSPNARSCIVSFGKEIGQWITPEMYMQLLIGNFPLSDPPHTACTQTNYFLHQTYEFFCITYLVSGTSVFQYSSQSEKSWSWPLFCSSLTTSHQFLLILPPEYLSNASPFVHGHCPGRDHLDSHQAVISSIASPFHTKCHQSIKKKKNSDNVILMNSSPFLKNEFQSPWYVQYFYLPSHKYTMHIFPYLQANDHILSFI